MNQINSWLRHLLVFGVVSAALGASTLAHADTISAFSLNSNLVYGTASGSLVVDTTTGVVSSGSITATFNGASETLSSIAGSTASNGLYTIIFTTPSGGSGDDFYLDLPISTLMNYAGGSLDTLSYNPAHASYLNSYNTMDFATSGTLNLASTTRTAAATTAVTPEVDSWILTLTGTGLLVALVHRRRAHLDEAGASGETAAA